VHGGLAGDRELDLFEPPGFCTTQSMYWSSDIWSTLNAMSCIALTIWMAVPWKT